ncbi:phenylalanine--tRNA ligase beta subunit-related protein [Candidatus Shikimatogenerans silvanidophilus]|uniref:phenylalanine--tRNA ligase beta subunit-related protein n=1 Tax=Candidatus Shikimatogenerans silvanidophilus TaxID=2782547 RepID=UPI001BA6DD1B|nr:phenylalanine--tRNA ligase beta subunit-related protein [Candidatus Shikimatogenerans silvanidophilus]
MIISYKWIKYYLKTEISFKEIEKILNNIGIEIEKIINNEIFIISLSPDKGYLTSHYYISKEIYAYLKIKKYSNIDFFPISIYNDNFFFEKNNIIFSKNSYKYIRRYSGLYLYNIDKLIIPKWIKNFLSIINIKPKNNITDIINFVINELGYPLNYYYFNKNNNIKFYELKNEKIIFLKKKKIILNKGEFLIYYNNKPISIPGICNIDYNNTTENNIKNKNIFIECASFNEKKIRFFSKKYKIKTESSLRFEKFVDPNLSFFVLKRILFLLLKINNNILFKFTDYYINKLKKKKILFYYNKVNKLIGKTISNRIINKILKLLDFLIFNKNNKILIYIPTYRYDITREIDIIEEIFRIYGYNSFKTKKNLFFKTKKLDNNFLIEEKIKNFLINILISHGFYEVINIPIQNNKNYLKFINKKKIIKILDSEKSKNNNFLRTNLLFGMLKNISFNIKRNNNENKFFEFGKVFFLKKKKFIKKKKLSIIMESNNNFNDSFFFIKGIIEKILLYLNIKNYSQFIENSHFYLEKCLYIKNLNNILLEIGNVKKNVLKLFNIKKTVIYSEINLKKIINNINNKKIKNINKFLNVKRDITILLEKNKSYEYIKNLIHYIKKKYNDRYNNKIKNIILSYIYENKIKYKNKKSYTFNIYIKGEKNLTEKKINNIVKYFKEKIEYLIKK